MGQAWKAFGKGFTNWNEWSKDPGRALGETIANVGALALGGESLIGDAGEAGEAGIAGEAGDASLAADAADAGTAGDSGDAGAADNPGAAGKDPAETKAYEELSPSEQRAVNLLRKRETEHVTKLEKYRQNPDAYDNQELLRNAKTPEIHQRIINGRIRHLENEIETFRKNIDDIMKRGSDG